MASCVRAPVLAVFMVLIICTMGHPMFKKDLERFKRSSMSETADEDGSSQRLPTTIRPLSYAVELQPDIYVSANFTLTGHVKILLECLQSTDEIVLHAKKLKIDKERIRLTDLATSGEVRIVHVNYKTTPEFLIITVDGRLEPSKKYHLYIEFSGELLGDLHGMYISTYEHDNQKHYTVVTQLEPTDARKMFPCWDEPIFKATFNVTVLRMKTMQSLSNMPLSSTIERLDKGEGWVADIFETTPVMSTYLVAVAVHDFKHISALSNSGTLLRVWAPEHQLNSAEYALTLAKKSTDFFESYTEIPYPLAKMDHIAVKEFAWGGMENWGLIVYSDEYLLFDQNKHGLKTKRDVSVIVNHEVAHQWFGNLVTCKWWDDLWLNEGFTSYMEIFGMSQLTPELEVGEFKYSNRDSVMVMDSLPAAQPVSLQIRTRADIMKAFGPLTYHKGEAIVGMLREIMGDKTFRTAIRRYLQKYKYGNADQNELYNVFTETIQDLGDSEGNRDLDVRTFMTSWIKQNNFPVITITRDQSGLVHFAQQRYLYTAKAKRLTKTDDVSKREAHPESSYQWNIPLFLATNATGEIHALPTQWLSEKNASSTTLQAASARPNDWILGNAYGHGFYRVNYDERNWELLSDQLNTDYLAIPQWNRAQLLDDVIELNKMGILHPVHALRMGRFLKHETRYLPWKVFLSKMETTRMLLAYSPLYLPFRGYMLEILAPIYRKLSWEAVAFKTGVELLKVDLLKSACHFELDACIEKAVAVFKNRKVHPIHPDFLNLVYCTAVQAGGVDTWLEVLQELKTADDFAIELESAKALTCTREPWLIEKFLNMTVEVVLGNPSPIGYGHVHLALEALARNPNGGHLGLKSVLKHWDVFQDLYLIEDICKHLGSDEDLSMFTDFRKTILDDLHDDEFEFCIEAMTVNHKWSTANANTIGEWLGSIYG